MPRVKNNIQDEISRDDVNHIALDIRNKYFNPNIPTITNLTSIINELNGSIYYDDSEYNNLMEMDKNGNFIILLTHQSTSVRDNFTITRCLGHYYLHTKESNIGESIKFGRNLGRWDWEATWFAAEFLMPKDLFREVAEEHNNDQHALSRIFSVSTAAATTRMEYLKIID